MSFLSLNLRASQFDFKRLKISECYEIKSKKKTEYTLLTDTVTDSNSKLFHIIYKALKDSMFVWIDSIGIN